MSEREAPEAGWVTAAPDMTFVVFDGGPWDGQARVVSTGPDGHPRMEYLSVVVDDEAPVPERARYRASPDAPAPGDPWRYEYDGRAW